MEVLSEYLQPILMAKELRARIYAVYVFFWIGFTLWL